MIRETRLDTVNECNYSNKADKTILNDLSKYPIFSDDIKLRANSIYKQMNQNTKRAKTRKLLLFFCVYNAYKELGIDVTPADLGEIFGLNSGHLQKSQSLFSHIQTGYKSVSHSLDVSHYIKDYCSKIGMDDYIDDILQLSVNIMAKDKYLSHSSAIPVAAAGMIKYYMFITGIELEDKTLLAKVSRRSETTIELMFKKISIIHNT